MTVKKIEPDTPIIELAICGILSQRAVNILEHAHLSTVREVALYHRTDPRYKLLGGCGLKTRRELNNLIKEAYGTLRASLAEPNDVSQSSEPKAKSWQTQWLEAHENDVLTEEIPLTGVAAEFEVLGRLTRLDRNFYAQCRAYATFICKRRGIPQSVSDLELHRWFLLQLQSVLPERRAAMFYELCQEIGM